MTVELATNSLLFPINNFCYSDGVGSSTVKVTTILYLATTLRKGIKTDFIV